MFQSFLVIFQNFKSCLNGFPNFHTSILLLFGLLKALKIKTDLRCYVNPTQNKPLTLLFSKPFTTQLATLWIYLTLSWLGRYY